MQGHDILFDIENQRIGIAESRCDFNYLISGKKSRYYNVFGYHEFVRTFYLENIFKSSKVKRYAILAFWVAHMILVAIHLCYSRGKKVRDNKYYYLKAKLSEEME